MSSSTIDNHLLTKSTAEILHDDQRQRRPHESDGEEEEEALSLRDLPITLDDHPQTIHTRRSSASDPTSDFFFDLHFLNDVITSSADDVILNGHLLPYYNTLRHPRRSLSLSSAMTSTRTDPLTQSTTRPDVIRPSRSMNSSRKLFRNNTLKTETLISRNSSSSSSSRCGTENYNSKSPWYFWLVFGLPARSQAVVELKDLKSRQRRRNIRERSLFSGGMGDMSGGSSRILSVLSCKSHASVDVIKTPSFRNSFTNY